MVDYIHANPLRRGLVERPNDWKGSSAAELIDERPGPLRVDRVPPDWLNQRGGAWLMCKKQSSIQMRGQAAPGIRGGN
ncbi:hypothetical protein [Stratiformator vulcanicus]|uniref:Transposase IS200-like domain-containing protein n=1 Tax=Stratiformator vulcanicus TaxID=2527980 RepID=A0A517QXA1_9PLAN|nr:hypothetical protein [Stratiformator vulcanicus]QDT36234.1 hypothetical protein Pan189_05890 [Stratiformator vulcanicus]